MKPLAASLLACTAFACTTPRASSNRLMAGGPPPPQMNTHGDVYVRGMRQLTSPTAKGPENETVFMSANQMSGALRVFVNKNLVLGGRFEQGVGQLQFQSGEGGLGSPKRKASAGLFTASGWVQTGRWTLGGGANAGLVLMSFNTNQGFGSGRYRTLAPTIGYEGAVSYQLLSRLRLIGTIGGQTIPGSSAHLLNPWGVNLLDDFTASAGVHVGLDLYFVEVIPSVSAHASPHTGLTTQGGLTVRIPLGFRDL